MEHNTRLLGGIAYIALIVFSIFASFLPFAGVVTLAADICVLVAFIQAGNQLGRHDIKNNVIVALVLYIVAFIVVMVLVGVSVVGALASGASALGAFGAGAIAGCIIGWILWMIAAWFWYKASVSLAEGSHTPLFKTGGLLMFIGAITLVVFGLGAIVMLIGQILQMIGFFNAPEGARVPGDRAF